MTNVTDFVIAGYQSCRRTYRIAVELSERHDCECEVEKGVYAAHAKKVGGGVEEEKVVELGCGGRNATCLTRFEFFRALVWASVLAPWLFRADAQHRRQNYRRETQGYQFSLSTAIPARIRVAMARGELSRSLRRAIDFLGRPHCDRAVPYSQTTLHYPLSRCISTSASRSAELASETPEPFSAAPPIDFGKKDGGRPQGKQLLRTLRVVPASPSYFSAKPTFNDDYISLLALLRKVATLPTVTPAEAPKVAWKSIDEYRIMTNEPVKTQRYHKMLHLLRRLNCVHPSLMPEEVLQAMERYKKASQPGDIVPKPGVVDEMGKAKGVGRRKTSSAVAWIIEGEGEVLVNGKSLAEYFGRVHDRESAVWALKATQRLDKYNVWGLVTGGGVTGQAEALTLAVAKALLVHEPALKPALRRGELVAICTYSISPSCPLPFALPTSLAVAVYVSSRVHVAFSHTFRPFSSRCPGKVSQDSSANCFVQQLAALRAIPGRWKGRRPATSRHARCPPGSSVEVSPPCILPCISLDIFSSSLAECTNDSCRTGRIWIRQATSVFGPS
jgi:small subunit ribosomal protein S9